MVRCVVLSFGLVYPSL